jgi:hypothetical protein
VLGIFFGLKNPAASAGFEPANLGPRGQHASCRPPKSLIVHVVICSSVSKIFDGQLDNIVTEVVVAMSKRNDYLFAPDVTL